MAIAILTSFFSGLVSFAAEKFVGLLKKSIWEMQSVHMRIVVILLIFVISGCATLNHDHPRKKNSLSETIETGKTGGNKRVHHDNDEDKLTLLEIIFDNENDPSENHELKMANEPNGGDDVPVIISFDVAQSIDASKQIDDISRYSLIGEVREKHYSFLVHIAITDYDFKKDWLYFNELEDPWAVEAGLALQYYFTKKNNFIQPFIKAGFACGKMYWKYASGIYDSQTGDEITGDSSEYSRLLGEFGINFKLNDSFDLSVDLQQDYTIYGETTGRGFEDDIMSNFGATMFGARLLWHF